MKSLAKRLHKRNINEELRRHLGGTEPLHSSNDHAHGPVDASYHTAGVGMHSQRARMTDKKDACVYADSEYGRTSSSSLAACSFSNTSLKSSSSARDTYTASLADCKTKDSQRGLGNSGTFFKRKFLCKQEKERAIAERQNLCHQVNTVAAIAEQRQRALDIVEKEKDDLQKELVSVKSELTAKDIELRKSSAIIQQLQKAERENAESMRVKESESINSLEEATQRRLDLQLQLQCAKRKLSAKDIELKEAQSSTLALQSELDEKVGIIQRWEADRLDDMKSRHRMIEEAGEELMRKEKELNAKLAEERKQLENQKADIIEGYEKDIKQLKSELQKSERSREILTKQSEQVSHIDSNALKELDALRKSDLQLRENLRSCQSEILELKYNSEKTTREHSLQEQRLLKKFEEEKFEIIARYLEDRANLMRERAVNEQSIRDECEERVTNVRAYYKGTLKDMEESNRKLKIELKNNQEEFERGMSKAKHRNATLDQKIDLMLEKMTKMASQMEELSHLDIGSMLKQITDHTETLEMRVCEKIYLGVPKGMKSFTDKVEGKVIRSVVPRLYEIKCGVEKKVPMIQEQALEQIKTVMTENFEKLMQEVAIGRKSEAIRVQNADSIEECLPTSNAMESKQSLKCDIASASSATSAEKICVQNSVLVQECTEISNGMEAKPSSSNELVTDVSTATRTAQDECSPSSAAVLTQLLTDTLSAEDAEMPSLSKIEPTEDDHQYELEDVTKLEKPVARTSLTHTATQCQFCECESNKSIVTEIQAAVRTEISSVVNEIKTLKSAVGGTHNDDTIAAVCDMLKSGSGRFWDDGVRLMEKKLQEVFVSQMEILEKNIVEVSPKMNATPPTITCHRNEADEICHEPNPINENNESAVEGLSAIILQAIRDTIRDELRRSTTEIIQTVSAESNLQSSKSDIPKILTDDENENESAEIPESNNDEQSKQANPYNILSPRHHTGDSGVKLTEVDSLVLSKIDTRAKDIFHEMSTSRTEILKFVKIQFSEHLEAISNLLQEYFSHIQPPASHVVAEIKNGQDNCLNDKQVEAICCTLSLVLPEHNKKIIEQVKSLEVAVNKNQEDVALKIDDCLHALSSENRALAEKLHRNQRSHIDSTNKSVDKISQINMDVHESCENRVSRIREESKSVMLEIIQRNDSVLETIQAAFDHASERSMMEYCEKLQELVIIIEKLQYNVQGVQANMVDLFTKSRSSNSTLKSAEESCHEPNEVNAVLQEMWDIKAALTQLAEYQANSSHQVGFAALKFDLENRQSQIESLRRQLLESVKVKNDEIVSMRIRFAKKVKTLHATIQCLQRGESIQDTFTYTGENQVLNTDFTAADSYALGSSEYSVHPATSDDINSAYGQSAEYQQTFDDNGVDSKYGAWQETGATGEETYDYDTTAETYTEEWDESQWQENSFDSINDYSASNGYPVNSTAQYSVGENYADASYCTAEGDSSADDPSMHPNWEASNYQ